MRFRDIKLDTISDYIFEGSDWPKPICNVKLESEMLTDMARAIFNKSPENGYVDIYADIDPERKFVTEFHLSFKDDDDSQDDIVIKVTEPADMVEYFKIFETQGGKKFATFIREAESYIYTEERASYRAGLVDTVDDFLEARNVRIPSSDKEMEEAGEDKTVNSARIYGYDYDDLAHDLENATGNGGLNVIKDRLKALKEYAEVYAPDELDFYTELRKEFSPEYVREVLGDEFADHAEEFWKEHGID